MIPRTTSIFHVGEEGAGEAAVRGGICLESSRLGASERLQGLRILIEDSGRQRSNVVINSSLKYSSCMAASAPQSDLFLKACLWCRKELSPHEDVYMYRGDQGFCSEECRGRQILADERRERVDDQQAPAITESLKSMKPPPRRHHAAAKAGKAAARHRRMMSLAVA